MLLTEFIVFIRKFLPLAVILETLNILWCELHLGEFLREVLNAILVVKLRFIWSSLLLFINSIPIYGSEPRMRHNFLSIRLAGPQPSHWVLVKQFGANVPGFFAQKWEVKFWLTVFNVSEKFFLIFAIEWWFATQHFINNTSEWPPVCRLSMSLIQKYFRRQIFSSTTDTFSIVMSSNVFFWKAKVSNFYVTIMTNENIFWFEISV